MSNFFTINGNYSVALNAANAAVASANAALAAYPKWDFLNNSVSALAACTYVRAGGFSGGNINAYDISAAGVAGLGPTIDATLGLLMKPAGPTNSWVVPWGECWSSSINCTLPAVGAADASGYVQTFTDNMTRADTLPGSIGGTGWTMLDPYNGVLWPAATDGYISGNEFICTPGGATIPGGGVAKGVVYAWQQSADGSPITHMKCTAVWTNNAPHTGYEGALGLVISDRNVATSVNAIHVTYDRANIISVGHWVAGGLIADFQYRFAGINVPPDGTTAQTYELIHDRWAKVITVKIGSNSQSFGYSANFAGGSHACWEIFAPPGRGDQPENQPAIKAASWGTHNGLQTYTSTVADGSAYNWITIPNDSNVHAFGAFIEKTAASVNAAIYFSCVGGTPTLTTYASFNTHTGVFDINNPAGGAPVATVTDCGDAWFLKCYVKNNSSGNVQLISALYPAGYAGRAAVGTCRAGGACAYINQSTVPCLVNTNAARAADTLSLTIPDGRWQVTALFGDAVTPQVTYGTASGGTGFTVTNPLNSPNIAKLLAA